MATAVNKRVLFVSYTYTQQARRVTEAMTDTLEAGGCDVTTAKIELADKRWPKNFSKFPMNNGFTDVLRMLPAQMRKATREIKVPNVVTTGHFGLVVIGSPTWWLTTSIPIRSFLTSPAADTALADAAFSSFVAYRRSWGFNHRTVQRLGRERGWASSMLVLFDAGPIRCWSSSMLVLFDAGPLRCWSYSMRRPEMARAITSCWICSVPSKMSKIFASRCMRSTGYSRV